MKFDVVTIFPGMIEAGLAEGVVGRAVARGVVDMAVHDLRMYTSDRHRSVDDAPYGGGPGMVMKPEPLVRAIEDVASKRGVPRVVVMPSPQGRPFTHHEAVRLSRQEHVVLLCGRYEGVDERVRDLVGAEELSIGDYVVSGGELAALVIVDAVSRLVPGVVGDSRSVSEESFAHGLLDYPHYTRPEVFRGMSVPEVLLSGDHEEVGRWRRSAALARTVARRPDLVASAALGEDEQALVKELRAARSREHHGASRAEEPAGASALVALKEHEDERD
jgi:tRNA (guanine37-N1)-methyltransferase